MLRFENQQLLYLLLIILFLIGGYIALFFIDRHRIRKQVDPELLAKLMPQRRKIMPHVKFALCMLALAFLIIAAANPQTPGKEITADRSGVDVLFCLDVSKSMNAQDVKPTRLDACKMAINHCINKMGGNRVGAVIFAGSAEVALPATTDYEAAKNSINLLNTNKIKIQGTNLSDALYRSAAAMGVSLSAEQVPGEQDTSAQVQKAIILISDGEDHAPDAVAAATQLNQHGILIFTIGIGTTTGATIPDGKDVKRDSDGRPVVTKLNEQILKDIAEKGGGSYTHAENVHASFDELFDEIDQMAKSDFGKIKLKTYESQYQYPLVLGLILLLVDGFLLMTKPLRKNKMKTAILLAVIGLLTVSCNHPTDEEQQNPMLASANSKFAHADSLSNGANPYELPAEADSLYHQALETYKEAAKKYPDFFKQSLFDQIDANYRIGNYDSIPRLADSLLQLKPNEKLSADVHYNIGNAHLANGKFLMELADFQSNDSLKNLAYNQYQAAIESYKSCLRLHPSDFDAKYNLTYAQKLLPKGGNGGGGNNGQGQNQQGQNGNGSQQGQQNQNGQQQGQNGQDQQQERKDQQQQMNQSGQGEKKEGDQKKDSDQGQQDDQQKQQQQGQNGDGDKEKKQGKQGQGTTQKPKSDEQKATERQLNALKQNDKDIQQKQQQLFKATQRQNMDKDW